MNIIEAEIRGIKRSGDLALVELHHAGDSFYSLIISNNESYIREGGMVKMLFKETEVALAKSLSGSISLRNRFISKIRHVKKGEILSEITLDYRGLELVSVITTHSFLELQVKEGDEVLGLVKTNELMLMQYD